MNKSITLPAYDRSSFPVSTVPNVILNTAWYNTQATPQNSDQASDDDSSSEDLEARYNGLISSKTPFNTPAEPSNTPVVEGVLDYQALSARFSAFEGRNAPSQKASRGITPRNSHELSPSCKWPSQFKKDNRDPSSGAMPIAVT